MSIKLDFKEEFKKPLGKPIILLEHEVEWVKAILLECECFIQGTAEYDQGDVNILELQNAITFLQAKKAGQ